MIKEKGHSVNNGRFLSVQNLHSLLSLTHPMHMYIGHVGPILDEEGKRPRPWSKITRATRNGARFLARVATKTAEVFSPN